MSTPVEHGDLIHAARQQSGFDKRTEKGTATPGRYCYFCGKELHTGHNGVWFAENHNTGSVVDWEPELDSDVYSAREAGISCAKKYLKGVKLGPPTKEESNGL